MQKGSASGDLVVETHAVGEDFARGVRHVRSLELDAELVPAGLVQTVVVVEADQQVGEANYQQGGAAHRHARPDRRNVDPPVVERSCNDRHRHQIVGEGPEEIHLDESIALLQESNQRQDLVQVLGQDDDVCCIDVQL